jgi:hypothetical protein
LRAVLEVVYGRIMNVRPGRPGPRCRIVIAVVLAGLLSAAPAALAEPFDAGTGRAADCDGRCYDTTYFWAVTRAVRDSSPNEAATLLLAPATLAIDVMFLPFAALLGLVGR